MSDYDVRPVITALANLVRTSLSPSPLKLVSEDVPNMQSTQAPCMFFDYVGGRNERDTYGSFERNFFVDCVALVGLAQNIKDTDVAIKSLVGPFYDLIATNHTLPTAAGVDSVFDAWVISDEISAPTLLGGVRYVAVTFRLQIQQRPATGGECA